MRKRNYIERFWEKVKKTSSCWIWNAYVNEDGYGVLGIADGKIKRTHRVSWEIHNGKIPKGMSVLHKCDVPACVNPKHLFLGTQVDNINDMCKKNRQSSCKGSTHHKAKLNETHIKKIRAHPKYPGYYKELSKKYNVTEANIGYILRRKTWKDVI